MVRTLVHAIMFTLPIAPTSLDNQLESRPRLRTISRLCRRLAIRHCRILLGTGNKGSDNDDVDEETEVKNFKYWANKIGHVFKKVRQTKKRRKSSYGSLFSSLALLSHHLSKAEVLLRAYDDDDC
ncbi:hypothetical protein MTO96_006622 [Rhipicephalus appendiculatus]